MSAGRLEGLVALVINFNTAPLTRRATRSLLEAGVLQVRVLDNASSPADFAQLVADHAGDDRVRIVRSEENLGFAAGSNRLVAEALADASCTRVLLLNSDAYVVAAGLLACLARMDEGGFALMGGRMLEPAAGGGEAPVESLGIALYKSLLASNRKRTADAYLGPTGGFAVYSRAFLEDVAKAHGHVFDPSYFCYAEDSDLAIRARLLGHAAGYADEVVAYHEGQGSHDGDRDAFILYHGIRNSIWMVAKSVPGRIILARLPWMVLLHGGIVLRHTVGGRFGTLLRLYRDAIAGLPAALRNRRVVQGTRRIEPKAFAAFVDRQFYDPDYVKGALAALAGRGPLA